MHNQVYWLQETLSFLVWKALFLHFEWIRLSSYSNKCKLRDSHATPVKVTNSNVHLSEWTESIWEDRKCFFWLKKFKEFGTTRKSLFNKIHCFNLNTTLNWIQSRKRWNRIYFLHMLVLLKTNGVHILRRDGTSERHGMDGRLETSSFFPSLKFLHPLILSLRCVSSTDTPRRRTRVTRIFFTQILSFLPFRLTNKLPSCLAALHFENA